MAMNIFIICFGDVCSKEGEKQTAVDGSVFGFVNPRKTSPLVCQLQ